MRATNVIANDDHTLFITFGTGEVKKFDVKPYLQDRFWAPLKNIARFKQAKTNGLTVTWNDEIDFCPDELYRKGEKIAA